MKTLFSTFILLFFASDFYAQNYWWAKSIGSATNDIGYSIAVDASGNVYITGGFDGTADFDPGAGTANLTSMGSSDIFFAKYNSSGDYQWAKSIGSASDDYGMSIAVDSSGNVYITGGFDGTADFDPGAGTANLTTVGLYDIFFAKYNSSGAYQWAKSIGSANYDFGNSIAVDASGNVYITGSFQGTVDFDPGAGTASLTPVGWGDIFFAKYNSSGDFQWAKSIGSVGNDMMGNSIAVDASGNVYITGYFWGTADFDPGAGTANLTPVGSGDIFFAKYNSSGNYQWAKSIGSASWDYGYSIAVDASGNVYIIGYFEGTADFDPGAGIDNLTAVGGRDIFFSKYNSSGAYSWAKRIGSAGTDIGNSIAVDDLGNVYITGWFEGTADFDPGAGTANLTTVGLYDIFFAKYGRCSPTYQDICLVTVDSASSKNIIVWEKPATGNIDSFLIYREIGLNNYVRIGSVDYSELSQFTDTTGGINPKIQSYRYKISVRDTCGSESALSSAHRTIHLATPQFTPPGTFDLIWTNDYEGFSFPYYYILRDGYSTGNWQIIDSVTYGNLSYTDLYAPGDKARYIIEAKPPQECNATLKIKKYNASKSNTSSMGVGIDEMINSGLSLYPNPNKGKYIVAIQDAGFNWLGVEIKIYNILGKVIYRSPLTNNNHKITVDLSFVQPGIYYIQLSGDGVLLNKKVVME